MNVADSSARPTRASSDTVGCARAGEWAWSTWLVNISGCLLIGVLMALITLLWPGQRLLRPFLAVGVLGGYTTFSAATVEAQQLIEAGQPGIGLLYLAVTALGGFVAVTAGWLATSALLRTVVLRRAGREREGVRV